LSHEHRFTAVELEHFARVIYRVAPGEIGTKVQPVFIAALEAVLQAMVGRHRSIDSLASRPEGEQSPVACAFIIGSGGIVGATERRGSPEKGWGARGGGSVFFCVCSRVTLRLFGSLGYSSPQRNSVSFLG